MNNLKIQGPKTNQPIELVDLKAKNKRNNNMKKHQLQKIVKEELISFLKEDVYDSSTHLTPYPDPGDPDQSMLDDAQAYALEGFVRDIEKFYDAIVTDLSLDQSGKDALRDEIISYIQDGL